MENLTNRLRAMETELLNLKSSVLDSKVEIVKLEKKLHESELKIEALEQAKAAEPLAVTPERCKCKCGLERKQAKSIIQKVSTLEHKCENLAKLQGVLNASLLRAQRKSQDDLQIENLQSQFISLSQDVNDLQSQMTCLEEAKTEKTQVQAEALEPDDKDSRLMTSFQKQLDLVRNHKLPLNFNDYVELSALECIASIATGPAWKHARIIFKRFDTEQSKHTNELVKRGCSEVQAMVGYIDVCRQAAQDFKQEWTSDSTFFYAHEMKAGYSDCILAIGERKLTILHKITKRPIKAWPLTAVINCEEKSSAILRLEVSNQEVPTEKNSSLEFFVGIAHEVSDLIKGQRKESQKAQLVDRMAKMGKK